MKISYTGKSNLLTEPQAKKLQGRLSKLAKFLDMKQGEREAHITLRAEKRSNYADLSVLYKGEMLATSGDGADMFLAVSAAVDKLERQLTKAREKQQDKSKRAAARDDKRGKTAVDAEVVTPSFQEMEKEEAAIAAPNGAAIHRVNHNSRRKPMAPEEAALAIRKNQNYLIFRDVQTQALSILLRRPDGDFDLIETAS